MPSASHESRIGDYSDTIDACRFCLMCRHLCTVGNQVLLESLTPRGRALNVCAAQKGLTDFDEDLADLIYKCSLCYQCKSSCVGKYDMPGLVRAARAELVARGKVPAEVQAVRDAVMAGRNPLGLPGMAKSTELNMMLHDPAKPADVLLLSGCSAAYARPNVVVAAAQLLEAGEVDFAVITDELCCGLPLYELGFRDDARRHGLKVAEALERTGCKVVVCVCPSCAFALREVYPKTGIALGERLKVVHLTEFLLDLIGQRRLRFRQASTGAEAREFVVTYHDPCYLSRVVGQHEVPRRLIAAVPGVTLTEARWNRDAARCCGGALMHTLYPSIGEAAAAARADELAADAAAPGVQAVVSACPTCEHVLARAAAKTPGLPRVMDIAELILAAM